MKNTQKGLVKSVLLIIIVVLVLIFGFYIYQVKNNVSDKGLVVYSGITDRGSNFSLKYPSSWVYYKYSCNNDGIAFWPKIVAPDVTKNLGCGMDSAINTAPVFVIFTFNGPEFSPLNGIQYKNVFDQMKTSLVY